MFYLKLPLKRVLRYGDYHSANQRPNTPCIRLWIDVIFWGVENSYSLLA